MTALDQFLSNPGIILDVRSPGEYAHAHIPGAKSLPLFTDAERAQVGTLYKTHGKDSAVELGLKIVGPKLYDLVNTAKDLLEGQPAKIHCWRGGMRSASMTWLLKTAGLQASSLCGGYKIFRQWVLQTLLIPRRLHIIGGYTGSGKTETLRGLRLLGEQTLDLELLANHKGSSYGSIGQSAQPSNEYFENAIAICLSQTCPQRILWVEDESKMIGKCKVPDFLYAQMRESVLFQIDKPKNERTEFLSHEYGAFSCAELMAATLRLKKRVGGKRAKEALACIENGEIIRAIETVLDYYDRTYSYGLSLRKQKPILINAMGLTSFECAEKIITSLNEIANVCS